MSRRRNQQQRTLEELVKLLGLMCALLCIALLYLTVFSSPSGFAQQRRFRNVAPKPVCNNETFDVVYTWVNGTDSKFLESMHQYSKAEELLSPNRFRDHNELKYSMRSLAKFAPWVNRVYLVTNGQVPNWLNTSRVTVVSHEEIFSVQNSAVLPTFSSPAIEANLHRIPGLSERFIYFNDDVFLAAPVHPEDFINRASGAQKVYTSWEIPDCAIGCAETFLGDHYCDLPCNVSACEFDLGDCINPQFELSKEEEEEEKDDDDELMGDDTGLLGKNEVCGTDGCLLKWIGDGICDVACRELACGYDGGDCERESKDIKTVLKVYDSAERIPIPNKGETAFLVKFDGEPVSPQLTKEISNTELVRVAIPVEKWDAILVIVNGTVMNKSAMVTLQVLHLSWRLVVLKFDIVDSLRFSLDGNDTLEGINTTATAKVDLFAQSLVYSKRKLQRHFGRRDINSKVPAHMPHLIDKRVLARLMTAFREEFDATSNSRFRRGQDMQYSYTYFTYLMTEQQQEKVDDDFVWSLLDLDGDGCLNLNEFRTLVAMVLQFDALFVIKPTKEVDGEEDEEASLLDDEEIGVDAEVWRLPEIDNEILLLAHDKIWQHSSNGGGSCMSFDVVQREQDAFAALQQSARATLLRTRAPYEVVQNSEQYVTFAHLHDDPKLVLRALDAIRARPTKFVCINDDTTFLQTNAQAANVHLALREFFEFIFPHTSEFELEENVQVQEEKQRGGGGVSWWWAIIFGVVGAVMLINRAYKQYGQTYGGKCK